MNRDWFARENWSEKKVLNDKSFDDLFKLDGIPLWWFYHRFFVPWVMPKHINTFKLLDNQENIKQLQKIKFLTSSLLMKKFIARNEARKLLFFDAKKEMSLNPKALFLSYTNHISEDGKIFRYQQMLNEIEKDQKIKSLLLFADPISKKTYKNLLGKENIYQYFEENMSKRSETFALKLNEKWKSLPEKFKEKMLLINQKSYWPYLKYSFDFFMSKEFLYATHLYYELFKSAIKKENVKVALVTGVSSIFERCLMAAAKHHKIKTIFVEHGLALHGDPPNPKILHDTTLAVFSNNFKDRLKASGVKESELEVVGAVVYDEIFKYMKPKESSEKRIFFATSPIVEINYMEKNEYFKRIESVLKQLVTFDGEIVIKLHPREIHLQEYEKICKNLGIKKWKVLRDISRDTYYSLIKESDYFFNLGSNSSIEGLILDKPVVTMNILDDMRLISWVKDFDVVTLCNYTDNLRDVMEKSKNDKEEKRGKIKDFISTYIGIIDGKASRRVVRLIEDEMNS